MRLLKNDSYLSRSAFQKIHNKVQQELPNKNCHFKSFSNCQFREAVMCKQGYDCLSK